MSYMKKKSIPFDHIFGKARDFIVIGDGMVKRTCKYSDTCGKRDCNLIHSKIPDCRFGKHCTFQKTCRFIHPEQKVSTPKFRPREFPNDEFDKPCICGSTLDYKSKALTAVLVGEEGNTVIIKENTIGQMIYTYNQIKNNDTIEKVVFDLQ